MRYYRIYILLFFFIFVTSNCFSQIKNDKYSPVSKINYDSIPPADLKNSGLNGIFISPILGMEFPVPKFTNTSKSGVTYGVKLEYANFNLYPFILGVIYQYQKNGGDENYLTTNLLNSLDTKINSFGVSIDVILNKYLKSHFTIPFLVMEFKYLSIQKVISPVPNNLNINTSDNTFGITGGLGFTLNIFDIYGTYTYAKDYSSAGLKMRIHFPIIKF